MGLTHRSNRLRVCNVDEEGRFGGPERRIVQVAVALKQYDVETHVIYPLIDSDIFEKNLKEHGIDASKLDITRLSKYWKTLLRYLIRFCLELVVLAKFFKGKKFDLVHVNGSYQFKVAIAAKLADIPVLWHLNDTSVPSVIKKTFSIVARSCADGFIVAGDRVRGYYLSGSRLEQLPIAEIHAPVDLVKFDPQRFNGEKKAKRRALRIGTVSGINPAKGLEYFIKMAAEVVETYPDIEFVIAGAVLESQKNYNTRILGQVNALGRLADRIEFVGFVHDVPAFISDLDICIFTSVTEASPTSVWEALAMAKPVVTTDAGSVSQYIQNGVSGFVVPVGDVDALSHRTRQLLEDPGLRWRMGKEARKVAMEKLGVGAAAEKHNDIYRHVVSTTLGMVS